MKSIKKKRRGCNPAAFFVLRYDAICDIIQLGVSAMTYCILCSKDIDDDEMFCPYCGRQQYPMAMKMPRFKKTKKEKPLFSTAEIITASQKLDDPAYLAFLATRLF